MVFMTTDLVFQYIIPMVVTAVFYQRIIHKLREREKWRKTSLEQCSSSDEMLDNDLKEKRRTVKLLIFIVLLFALSWLPYHLFYPIWEYFLVPRNIHFGGYDITIILALHSFAVTSICYNPFLYWGFNKTFKREIMRIFRLI
ncbi:orphan G-protein coupled receptor 40-like protein [Leptotrombidium deliense]|uniref:Orphan G-protein coupled receptor 40-like protein n=1 Tax=Leptotrombidium deliense TaxID=299467 RepID=A0A443SK07_9ACAR|nr:orphan G-protein coupled receptor 40-like protein [Leptotrombidium deliense]